MAYNFMLVMTNTGMRTMEARNLRWRDVDVRTDKHDRQFVCINVRGKGKFRELVAASNVASYLDRIKAISKATKPDDFVFTTDKGKPASVLYGSLIESLLTESGLLHSSSGSRRSTYCFRHTYATFRLTEGLDVYFLAKQMGTSVKMIEDYYGHITPAKNAERILQGIPGWEPIADGSGGTTDSVNAGRAGKPAKPRKK
jgi:integrase